MHDSIRNELRHRDESLVEYPDAALWKKMGGNDGVAALFKDLYRRIEQDDLLRTAFPHFGTEETTQFFIRWYGGSRGYADNLAGGLLRWHQHRYISARDATQNTLLMLFARQGKVEPVRWLLAHGAHPNARNRSGKTAAERGRSHPEIVRMSATR